MIKHRRNKTMTSNQLTGDITTLFRALLNAWNARDAKAFAALFASDGNVVGFDGSQMDGPDAIAATLGQIFADHPTASYVAQVREVRSLDRGVALLRAVAGMVPPGATEINPPTNAIQTLVAVNVENQWRIAIFQNTPAQFHGRPELAKALTEELQELVAAGS
jgi:uncharacterized protein (TIGR02246 family)